MDNLILPNTFLEKATFLANEPCWQKEDAQAVVNFFKQSGYAVLGVEIWKSCGEFPQVLGWSEYEVLFDGDWIRFVQLNAQYALLDIERAGQNELINLKWVSQTEFEKL
jgi:hypothetical protein